MSTVIDDIKNQFKNGSMTTRLIIANAIVFVFVSIANMVMAFASPSVEASVHLFIHSIFTLNTSLKGFILHPWGIFTSIFTHFGLLHFAINMLMLYSIGRLFEHYLSQKRLFATYILGGIAGNLLEMVAQNAGIVGVAPVVGASGAVFAIIFAMAAYIPQFQISVWGLFNLNLRTLAIILFLFNILSIGTNNGTAYFAHIGGALLGYFTIKNHSSSSNIVTRFGNLLEKWKGKFKKKSNIKIVRDDFKSNASKMKDEDYNAAKKQHQEQTNSILDKISKSGYESLTKEEKDFLFKQSKNA